jgi:predicted  nucleic acid-binding Zn-ribbon protein
MKKQLSLLSKLQSFDNRLDTMYKSGLSVEDKPEKLTKKQKLLVAERQGLTEGISKPLLRTYERMRDSRLKSNAVVRVINGVCQGCFLVVTKSVIMQLKKGNNLILCEHCGRILFMNDGSAE